MLLFLVFWLGASVGSFLNVCIWRLPRGESIVQPPSHCPHCNTRLRALDLVPLGSQLLLRGRCRYCGARFSWRYFGIEALTGALFMMVGIWAGPLGLDARSGAWTGDGVRLLQGLVFVSTLVIIFWVDYDTRLIQLESVLLLGLAGVAGEAWSVWRGEASLLASLLPGGLAPLPAPLPASLVAMLVVAGVLWLLRAAFSKLYNKEALGFGDVLLVGAIAAHLGWNSTLFTFGFLSVTVGAAVGVALKTPRALSAYAWAKRRGRPRLAWPLLRHAFRKGIPFGPMLALGGVVALLFGARLNAAYVDWIAPPNPPGSVALSGAIPPPP